MLTRSKVLIALLMIVALIAAACGSDESETDTASDTTEAPTTTEAATTTEAPATTEATTTAAPEPAATLVVWADEKRAGPMGEIAPAFTEATGVEVEVEQITFDDMKEQVNQAIPAGEGPDIFVGSHDWTGELAANGLLEPVDVGAISANIVPASLNAFNFEGQNFALPYVIEAVAMYRNVDLVPEAPTTFDEVQAACDAAAVANCLVVPGGGAAPDAYHNYPFVSAFGGGIFAFDQSTGFDASNVILDSAESVEGAEYLEAAVAAGTVASTDYDGAKNLFLEGEAAFWITGPWELGGLADTDVNWEASLIPQFGDDPAQPFFGAQGFYMSAFSENKLIAQSFIQDFIATDDVMQALYDADPRGTAWIPVQDGLADDPNVATFAASAANGIPMPNIPEMGAVWGPLGDNMLLVRNGELGGAEAMTAIAEAVRAAVAG